MLIGVISDTHGNLAGWEQAWSLGLKDADVIFHCGDMLYHGPKFAPPEAYDPKALAEAINGCGKPVLVARGNGDSEVDQLVLEVPIQQPCVFAVIEGTRILATHGHLMTLDSLANVADKWGLHLVFTGHTHVPVIGALGKAVHVNPGTVTYPLATEERLKKKTFALIKDGRLQIVDIETGAVVLS